MQIFSITHWHIIIIIIMMIVISIFDVITI